MGEGAFIDSCVDSVNGYAVLFSEGVDSDVFIFHVSL